MFLNSIFLFRETFLNSYYERLKVDHNERRGSN